MVASLYRSATAYMMPILPESAEVTRLSVDQLFDVSATKYSVSGPLMLTNVMPNAYYGDPYRGRGLDGQR